jgi:hypothetical protein
MDRLMIRLELLDETPQLFLWIVCLGLAGARHKSIDTQIQGRPEGKRVF